MRQGSYSDVERGKAQISATLLKRLTELYRVNPTYLLTGHGPLFLHTDLVVPHLGEQPHLNPIPLLRHELVPTYLQQRANAHWLAALPFLHLPDLTPEYPHIAIAMRHDAMAPTLYPGDVVVGTECHPQDVLDNRVYVVFLRNGAWAVRRLLNRTQRDGTLLLKCDNQGHATYPLPTDEVDHLLQVERRITAKMHGPDDLYDRLNKLEQEIWDLKTQRP